MIKLIGRSTEYEAKTSIERLPKELGRLRHSIPWPIAVAEVPFQLACYFNETNYSDPTWSEPHRGLDIQTNAGVSVTLHERAKVVYCKPKRDNFLANLYLWGEETNIEYGFIHLEPDSVSQRIRNRTYVIPEEDIVIEAGEVLGIVGKWPLKLSDAVIIAEDAQNIFGKNFHHLHLEMTYVPFSIGSREYLPAKLDKKNLVDPRLLLQRINAEFTEEQKERVRKL